MDPESIVAALRTVPEKRLRLIELAWELVGEGGGLDPRRVALRMEEVELADAEARGYAEATRRALWGLQRLAR